MLIGSKVSACVCTHSLFHTSGFNIQQRNKRNILESFFIHMQTDVAQLLPRCNYRRNYFCPANQRKLPSLHEEKRRTKAQRAKINPYLPTGSLTAIHTQLKKIHDDTPHQVLHLKTNTNETILPSTDLHIFFLIQH